MTRERIDALEVEKAELKGEIARLLKLEPENARLQEALSNAEANNVVATILIVAGGFLVSYATFTGRRLILGQSRGRMPIIRGHHSFGSIHPPVANPLNPTRGCPSVQFRLKSP